MNNQCAVLAVLFRPVRGDHLSEEVAIADLLQTIQTSLRSVAQREILEAPITGFGIEQTIKWMETRRAVNGINHSQDFSPQC